jgi:hypothetical protein
MAFMRRLALISLALAASACIAPTIDGIAVRTGDCPSAGSAAAIVPVPEARARVNCPDLRAAGLQAKADAQGWFKVAMETRFHRRCTLTVEKDGFVPGSVVLGDVCGRDPDDTATSDYCPVHFVVVVGLQPAVPPGQAQKTPPAATAPATTPATSGIANPASVYCTEQGGKLEMREGTGGTAGYCHLPDGRVVEEWELYRTTHPQP